MKAQNTNQVVSSALLFLDHNICSRGEAFYNVGGLFYGIQGLYQGLNSYGAQFSNFIVDSSITGANLMTGIYINNNFVTTGQSGLFNIDYQNGNLYFSTGIDTKNNQISGNFSIREIDIRLTTDAEETLFFEKKHYLKPKINQAITGLNTNEHTYPIIYIKENGGRNTPFQFGGTDISNYNIKCIILADSMFQLDGIKSIIRDTRYSIIPLIDESEFPLNPYGGLNFNYNYTGLAAAKASQGKTAFIADAFISDITPRLQTLINNNVPEAFIGMADLKIEVVRNPGHGIT